ncbi:hypothetical protein STEG23_010085 [Scotinomys teguina]
MARKAGQWEEEEEAGPYGEERRQPTMKRGCRVTVGKKKLVKTTSFLAREEGFVFVDNFCNFREFSPRLQRQFQDKKEQDADSPGEAIRISGECRIAMSSCKRSHNQKMLTKLSSLHKELTLKQSDTD